MIGIAPALGRSVMCKLLSFGAPVLRGDVGSVTVDALRWCVWSFARFFWCVNVSTSHTPYVAVTVPGGMPELVAVMALYWVVSFLELDDPDSDVSDCLQVFYILKANRGCCN